MLKLLSAEQIRQVDKYTIEHEPVKSIDLMERAAFACVKRIIKLTDPDDKIIVVSGKGNNGGDGLAITRLLAVQGFDTKALVIHYTDTFTADAQTNYSMLKQNFPSRVK